MMKHKIHSVISVLLLLAMALSLAACAGGSNDLRTVTLEEDEFRYTLRSDKLEYSADELNADKPFHVTLAISYTGEQDSISLWCVDDLGTISMEDANGKPLLSDEFHSRDTSRITLQKGKPYVIEWNGASEYKEYDGIPAGQYKVVAYVNFSTDASYDSIQENTLDLSLKIK